MKNVLLLLHEDKGQEARLQAALDLTRALSGHLICLDVVGPPHFITDYFSRVGYASVLEYACDREADNRTIVEERLRDEDVPWTMLDTIGGAGDELSRLSDLADIIVISAPGEHADADAKRVVGDVAVRSGHPVLVVPPSCRGFDIAGHALVAWNGSHEASQALRSAVPLLQRATAVTVLDLNQPSGDYSVGDAAAYLSRHAIHAEIVEQRTQGPISEAILAHAHALGAAYLVIGAYGLPRWVEAVFGGVTAGTLRKSNIPILLAH